MSILDQIAEEARSRVDQEKKQVSLGEIQRMARQCESDGFRFYETIGKSSLGIIAEIKKASPSKGIIDPVFDYMNIAKEYEFAGVDAISCLTEPKWFLGSDQIFSQVRTMTKLPMLRKDFIVDEYQIYQAKALGADCVLLIVSLLDEEKVKQYLDLCQSLRLAALVETHDEEEVALAIHAGARMIGVNNRDLKDFSVDLSTSARLRKMIPEGCLFVAESGIRSIEDALAFKGVADAVLVGEALMRSQDKVAMIRKMKEDL